MSKKSDGEHDCKRSMDAACVVATAEDMAAIKLICAFSALNALQLPLPNSQRWWVGDPDYHVHLSFSISVHISLSIF